MSRPAIITRNLGKKFIIPRNKSDELKDYLILDYMKNRYKPSEIFNRLFNKNKYEEVWAIRNISFDLEKGSVVGLIGKNGAGKSTLLKVLSKITDPSEGEALIYGRIGSMLEVGTGFHYELTGRENILLSGTILGMKRKEIEKKTDEIIAFSGIEKYIDTPIKKYSSGMSVRLAFSVSAHLDTDILLVDEVLSVGDADFRKQSLEKMKNIVQDGRTIIFVSHNMNSIRELCEEVFWIEKGNLKMTGPVNQVITNYLQLGSTTEGSISWEQGYLNESSSGFDVFGVEVLDENKQVSATIEHARDFDIVLEWVLSDNSKYQIMYRLLSPGGSTVVQAQYEIEPDSAEKDQRQKLYSRWNSSVASPGLYQLSIKVKREGTDIIHLDKVMSLAFSDEHMGLPEQNGDLINLDWRIE